LDDIYAVGASIYELITGRPPFYDGGFEQIKVQIREMVPPTMERRILDLGLHMPPPPDAWEDVVAACLAKRPEDRPQSMRAVAAALGFQSGSNTELEAKVSSQVERINELETQLISLSHGTTGIVSAESEEQLAEARNQIAALQESIGQSQAEIGSLAAMLDAARSKERQIAAERDAALTQEQQIKEALEVTTAERDAALQGGDTALQRFQEDSAKRIAHAEGKLATLQQELAAAKNSGDAVAQQARQAAQQQITELEGKLQATRKESEQLVQTAKKDAELAVQTARKDAERLAQTAKKEAEQAVQATTEKSRREAEQLAERLRKTEESKEKAINQAREEGEKRLLKQTDELEKTRQSLTKVAQQKEQLERAVATEKERQGASLRPLLVGLLIAMVLGLGGGFLSSWWSGRGKADVGGEVKQEQIYAMFKNSAPKPGDVADKPVSFELFQKFAKEVNTTADKMGGIPGNGEAVYGINGITAMNFCNWLTEKMKKEKSPVDYHYTLPDIKDLEGKIVKGKAEWSKTWANIGNGSGLVWQMQRDDGPVDVHASVAAPNYTFRLKLEELVPPKIEPSK
jgi:hypothetical protein